MYVYRTKGICPPEIHFELSGNTIKNVRFVGGGCKGNAQLISRLMEGRDVSEMHPLLEGIQCRNDTSCPDQLSQAIELVQKGELTEADSIKVYEAPTSYSRVAVIAEVNGNLEALRAALQIPAQAVFCLGNLTGPGGQNDAVVELARKQKLIFAQGTYDRSLPCAKPENQDFILQAPLFLSFRMGEKQLAGFYSGFIQDIKGFSDFSRFSLELLMVSNLSDYLRNETVYPALEAMTGQFTAEVVLFAYTGTHKHINLGKADFVNVGPLQENGAYKYALLEWEQGRLRVSYNTIQPAG